MKIPVSQLIPGYTLTEDVMGKTINPIVKKDTVLTKDHILILEKFLIQTVKVSKISQMKEGSKVKPSNDTFPSIQKDHSKKEVFFRKFKHAVVSYKEYFHQWQNNIPIDILAIRKFLLPLLENTDEMGIEVYQLYRYSNAKDYLYYHDISVAVLSAHLANKMGYKKGDILQIGMAGFLSNCGKAKLAKEMFIKNESLAFLENKEMKNHPKYSYELIKSISLIKDSAKIAILQHHERLDGSGYPLGMKRGKIHPFAQIIAICDVYHAMTSDRVYQKKCSPFQAINELDRLKYFKFNAKMVQSFIKSFTQLSLRQGVQLSNLQTGRISFFDAKKPKYPLIILDDNQSILSLEDKRDLFITDFLFGV